MVEHIARLDGFGEGKNLLALPVFEPWTIYPIACCCTNYALLAPVNVKFGR